MKSNRLTTIGAPWLEPGRTPFLRAGFGVATARLLARGALFATVLAASRSLDPAGFGAYSYVFAYLVVAGLVGGLGLEQTAMIRVASARSAGSRDLLDAALRHVAPRALVGAGLSGMAVAAVVSPVLGHGLETLSAGVIAASVSATAVGAGVLRGLDRPVAAVVVLEGGRGVAMLAGAAWLAAGLPADLVWTATAAASILLLMTCAGFAAVRVRRERGRLAAMPPVTPRPASPAGEPRQLHFFGVLLATNLYLWLCPVVLERAGPIDEVGMFNVAMQLPALITFLSTSLELALMGRIAEAHAAGDLASLQPALRAAARLLAVTVLPAAAILFVLREPLLVLFGEPYRAASTAMGLAIVAQVVSVACGPAGYLVLLGGRARLNMAVMAASSLAGLAVLIALAGSLGHIGAAIGFLVATVAANLTLAAVCLIRLGVDPTLAAALVPSVRKGCDDAA